MVAWQHPKGITYKVADDAEADLFRVKQCRLFVDEGIYPADSPEIASGRFVDKYSDACSYLIGQDNHGYLSAGCRVVQSSEGLPTLDHQEMYPRFERSVRRGVTQKNFVEVSGISVFDQDFGGFGLLAGLHKMIFHYCYHELGASTIVGSVEASLFALIEKVLMIPTEQLGPESYYRGAVRVPLLIDMAGFIERGPVDSGSEYFLAGLRTYSGFVDS